MSIRPLLAAGLLACAFGAQATTTQLLADGSWNAFDVDVDNGAGTSWYDIGNGTALDFQFTVDPGFVGRLTVVDAVFAGDTFTVSANGLALGSTSAATNTYPADVGYDYDAALADAAYSRGVFTLAAGSHTITGALASSAVDDLGTPFNATNGALKLTVSPVPETSTLAMLLAGLAALPLLRRRAR